MLPLSIVPPFLVLSITLVVSVLIFYKWIFWRSPGAHFSTLRGLKVVEPQHVDNAHHDHSILVIGGAGFIGRHVVAQMLDKARVSVFDVCLPESPSPSVRYFVGDMMSQDQMKQALRNIDTVFLLAAKKPSIYSTFASLFEINTIGVQQVVNACIESGVERLIFTSTASATAHARGKPSLDMDEAWPFPSEHMCDYSRTKALAERIVSNANGSQCGSKKDKTLYTCTLRPTAVYGIGDNSLISMIFKKQGSARFIGDGKCLIDFVDVGSVAHAHVCAFDRLSSHPLDIGGHTFNIGSGKPMSLKKFVGAEEDSPGSGRNHWQRPIAKGFPLWVFRFMVAINKMSVSWFGRAILGRSVSPTAISHTQSSWTVSIKKSKSKLGYCPTLPEKSIAEISSVMRRTPSIEPGFLNSYIEK